MRRVNRLALALALAATTAVGALPASADAPDRDPRNWPTITRLVQDRYERAGEVFTLRVHARKTELDACGYHTGGQLMAFSLLGGPFETLTGYMPVELGRILERVLEADPWAQVTVQVRFAPDKLSDLCPSQVDVLKWSRGWQYPSGTITPGKPDPSQHPTPERIDAAGQKQLWKDLRQMDSEQVGQRVQLTAGAHLSTSYLCAFRGATKTHYALRLHNGRGQFVQAYLPRNEKTRKLVDFIALHRDVLLSVQARVVQMAQSDYCRPQLEISSWTLPGGE